MMSIADRVPAVAASAHGESHVPNGVVAALLDDASRTARRVERAVHITSASVPGALPGTRLPARSPFDPSRAAPLLDRLRVDCTPTGVMSAPRWPHGLFGDRQSAELADVSTREFRASVAYAEPFDAVTAPSLSWWANVADLHQWSETGLLGWLGDMLAFDVLARCERELCARIEAAMSRSHGVGVGAALNAIRAPWQANIIAGRQGTLADYKLDNLNTLALDIVPTVWMNPVAIADHAVVAWRSDVLIHARYRRDQPDGLGVQLGAACRMLASVNGNGVAAVMIAATELPKATIGAHISDPRVDGPEDAATLAALGYVPDPADRGWAPSTEYITVNGEFRYYWTGATWAHRP